MDLVFAGLVARPLYMCTEVVEESTREVCMNVASMSPFLENSEGRSVYRCRECVARARDAQAAPGSASASLRGLWAFPMVEGVGGRPTPLRMTTKVQLLVHAPPDTWGRGLEPQAARPTDAAAAEPQVDREAWYRYTKEESDRMWSTSTSYQGSPSLVQ